MVQHARACCLGYGVEWFVDSGLKHAVLGGFCEFFALFGRNMMYTSFFAFVKRL